MGGATYGAYQAFEPETEGFRAVSITPVVGRLNATAGSTLALPFSATATGGESLVVRVASSDTLAVASSPVTLSASGATGAFFPITIPAGAAPGEHLVVLSASTDGEKPRQATARFVVRILGAGVESVDEGETARVWYAGRLANGTLFDTNIQAVAISSIPKSGLFRPSPAYQPLDVTTGRGATTVPGFWKGVVGMKVGETRTIVVPPSDGYGNKSVPVREARETVLDRIYEVPLRVQGPIPIRDFASHLSETKQGVPSDYEAGDTFRFTDRATGSEYNLVVLNITSESMTYRFQFALGERYTLPDYEAWKNASEVVSVNDTAVQFRVTPTQALGEPFTFHARWPGASEVVSVTDTEIVVRHSPAIGTQWTDRSNPFQQPRQFTVTEVSDDAIVATYPNPSPLGGETLTFDVTVLGLKA